MAAISRSPSLSESRAIALNAPPCIGKKEVLLFIIVFFRRSKRCTIIHDKVLNV